MLSDATIHRLVRECHQNGDAGRISQIIEQLIDLFVPTSNALHVRNGGLIGLAATAIALGVEIAPYMPKFMDPLLVCFSDMENRVRYFACESMYNIAKVSKGEILIYFNPIFDALSKVSHGHFFTAAIILNDLEACCGCGTLCEERGRTGQCQYLVTLTVSFTALLAGPSPPRYCVRISVGLRTPLSGDC